MTTFYGNTCIVIPPLFTQDTDYKLFVQVTALRDTSAVMPALFQTSLFVRQAITVRR